MNVDFANNMLFGHWLRDAKMEEDKVRGTGALRLRVSQLEQVSLTNSNTNRSKKLYLFIS